MKIKELIEFRKGIKSLLRELDVNESQLDMATDKIQEEMKKFILGEFEECLL